MWKGSERHAPLQLRQSREISRPSSWIPLKPVLAFKTTTESIRDVIHRREPKVGMRGEGSHGALETGRE